MSRFKQEKCPEQQPEPISPPPADPASFIQPTESSQNLIPDRIRGFIHLCAPWLLLGLLALISFIVLHKFLLLEQVYLFKDIGSDTINVFYPALVHTADLLRLDGIPRWSFSQGMGQNIFGSSYLGDPFSWILFLMGSQQLAYGIAYVELLKIILAGLFFHTYLRQLRLEPTACIVGGLLYAFSGVMILGGTWYIFSTAAVHFSLTLLAMERWYQKKSWWLLTVAVALTASFQVFNLYLFSVFFCFYAFFRYLQDPRQPLSVFFHTHIKAALAGLLGLGISSVFFLSNLLLMIQSPRATGASYAGSLAAQSPFLPAGAEHYLTAISRFFSSDLLGIGSQFSGWSNYLEAPILYTSIFSLLLAPQVFLFISKKDRWLYGTATALAVLLVAAPYPRRALWLFSGDYYRIVSVFIAFIPLLFSLKTFSLMTKGAACNRNLLYATWCGLFFLLLVPRFSYSVEPDNTIFIYCAGFLCLYGLWMLCLEIPALRRFSFLAILLTLCAELTTLSSMSVNQRPSVTSRELTDKSGYQDYTLDALKHLADSDPQYYRINKGYSSGSAIHRSLNDAKVQGFHGSASYHSFNQNHYIQFLTELEIISPEKETETRWAPGLTQRPFLLTFASAKYHLSKRKKSDFLHFGFTPYAQFGNVTVLKNQNFLPFGFTYDRAISLENFRRLSQTGKDIALLRACVIEDPTHSDFNAFEVMDVSEIQNLNMQSYIPDSFTQDVEQRRQEGLELHTHQNNQIHGTLSLSRRKILFFSIPFDPGWKIKINGEPRPLQKMNIGFMGLPLEAGTHEISLTYTPPLSVSGLFLSLASILLFVFLLRRGSLAGQSIS